MSLYDCHNCKHDDKNALQVPCKACRGKGDEKPTMWEPCDSFIAADVLPCPFCGNTEKEKRGVKLTQQYGRANYYVMCHGCGVSTDYFSKSKDAINAWNRRA